MAKGKSGSFRANSLTPSDLKAMENHELRLDHSGSQRSVRKDENGNPIPPLIYNPLNAPSLTKAHAKHIEGAKVNKGASKIARHAFIQFPTELEITPQIEQMMLDQAVAFVNKTHGGQAVFWARLDRDEEGRHGVDVFFAPKYEKATKRKTEVWISLTKFGKERAVERFKQKPLEKLNPKSGEFEPVKDAAGNVVMVDCDSQYYQGRTFQDLWFEHLRDAVGLSWVQRGEKKIGRDPDRKEVEEYKIGQEREKLEAKREEIQEYEATASRVADTMWDRASDASNREEASLKSAEEAKARAREAQAEEREARQRTNALVWKATVAQGTLMEAQERLTETQERLTEAESRLSSLTAFLEPLRPALELVERYRQQVADYQRAEASKDAVQAIDFERAKKWLLDGYLKIAPLDEKADPQAAAEFIHRLKAGLQLPKDRSEIIETDLDDLLHDLRQEDPSLDNLGNKVSPLMVKTLLKNQSAWPVTAREMPNTGEIRAKVDVDVDALRSVYGLPPQSSDERPAPDRLYRWQKGEPTLNLFIHRIGEALTRIGTWLRVRDPVATPKPQMPPEAKPFLELPRETQKAVEEILTQPAPSSPRPEF